MTVCFRYSIQYCNSVINLGFFNILFADKFTDTDIIGNAILMFAAGSETVASMLSFCLYELAFNKEIQDKLRAEICAMNAKHDGQLSNDYLMDLHYTTMVLEGMTIFTNYIRDDPSIILSPPYFLH